MRRAVARPSADLDAISAVPLAGIGMYVVASILYVFPPGLPQPADFILVLTLSWTFSLYLALFAGRADYVRQLSHVFGLDNCS